MDFFSRKFASEQFWFPKNVTWDSFKNKDDSTSYPESSSLLLAVPLAALMYILRLLVERFIFGPICEIYKVKNSRGTKPEKNTILEKVFYSVSKFPDDNRIRGLSKQLDWSESKVQSWFRRRRNQDKPSPAQKFNESGWRFLYYLSATVFGSYIAITEGHLFNTRDCWIGYPFQSVTSQMWWYYVLQLSCYYALIVSQFSDIKRKDFVIMFTHHIITILLIYISFMINFLRIGNLVFVVHDASDILLELAKLLRYVGAKSVCTVVMVMFAATFFVTRLYIFPFWIIYSVHFESWEIIGPHTCWYLTNSLLWCLVVLHVVWSYMIVKVIVNALKGQLEDSRSDPEREVSDVGFTGNGSTTKRKD